MAKQKQSCRICGKKIEPEEFLCPYCGCLPISIQIIDGAKEMIPLTIKLNTKINLLRDFFGTLKLSPDDERNQLLGSLSQITGWLNTQLIIYTNYFKTPDSPIPQKIRKENPSMSKKQLQEIVLNFDKINRMSYLTHFMFRVEVFLKRLAEILLSPSPNYGYKNLVKHVLKELGMGGQDSERFRILYFPAIVRNSLHMDGSYTEKNIQGKINNIPFRFTKGKRVRYASWRNLYFFCDKILYVIEEIMKHEKVGNQFIPKLPS